MGEPKANHAKRDRTEHQREKRQCCQENSVANFVQHLWSPLAGPATVAAVMALPGLRFGRRLLLCPTLQSWHGVFGVSSGERRDGGSLAGCKPSSVPAPSLDACKRAWLVARLFGARCQARLSRFSDTRYFAYSAFMWFVPNMCTNFGQAQCYNKYIKWLGKLKNIVFKPLTGPDARSHEPPAPVPAGFPHGAAASATQPPR